MGLFKSICGRILLLFQPFLKVIGCSFSGYLNKPVRLVPVSRQQREAQMQNSITQTTLLSNESLITNKTRDKTSNQEPQQDVSGPIHESKIN